MPKRIEGADGVIQGYDPPMFPRSLGEIIGKLYTRGRLRYEFDELADILRKHPNFRGWSNYQMGGRHNVFGYEFTVAGGTVLLMVPAETGISPALYRSAGVRAPQVVDVSQWVLNALG